MNASGGHRAESLAWRIERGSGPVLAVALHDGHRVSGRLERYVHMPSRGQLHEKDPLAGIWAHAADSSVYVFRSHLEVDLNRPRDEAVAAPPEDFRGRALARHAPPPDVVESCLDEYDSFYEEMDALLRVLLRRHSKLLILDLHSHDDRPRADAPAVRGRRSPAINVGTGTMMRRERWAKLIDRFIASLRRERFCGRPLDVHENVDFFGGFFPEWVHVRYPKTVCVLSIECRRFYLDDRRGGVEAGTLEELQAAFERAADAARKLL